MRCYKTFGPQEGYGVQRTGKKHIGTDDDEEWLLYVAGITRRDLARGWFENDATLPPCGEIGKHHERVSEIHKTQLGKLYAEALRFSFEIQIFIEFQKDKHRRKTQHKALNFN